MAVIELLNLTDWYFHIPISNEAICMVHFIITAIFLFFAIYMYVKRDKKPSCGWSKK